MKFVTITVTTTVMAVMPYFGASARAQTGADPDRLSSIRQTLEQTAGMLEGLPPSAKKRLSSGAQNLLKLAQGWGEIEGAAAMNRAQRHDSTELRGEWAALADAITTSADEPTAATFPISNSSTDFLFSLMAGFTQSETSTAWCGDYVVTGFNDSGSVFESILFGPGGASFSGASISKNKGVSFHDVGYINPGTDFNNLLAGDPVVTCTQRPTGGVPVFFYTQLFERGPATAPVTAIGFSKSEDGGGSWASPVATVEKDARTHFLDKSWSAVDPTNPNKIVITYTDFDQSGTSGAPACGIVAGRPVLRTAIELVQSSDGGVTWSAPLVIAQGCDAAPTFLQLQGSQVAVDAGGKVYVAWASSRGPTGLTRALMIVGSATDGATFGAPATISNVVATGDGNGLQGGFRNNEFPMLAIDRSSGALWVAWNDGRNFAIRDVEAPDGLYHFADVLISRSTSGGATWSAPMLVSPPQAPHLFGLNVLGTDHYQPGIAVDKTGAVGVCWYDRRGDPANFKFGRACVMSTNAGLTWAPTFLVNANWSLWHATDVFINPAYFGDYDSVASDFLMVNPGFLGAYGWVNTSGVVPNQDVAVFSFP
jgi:hypothetical protein